MTTRLRDRVAAAWKRLPGWLRAAVNTAWATWLAVVFVPVVKFLDEVGTWIGDPTAPTPDVMTFGRFLASTFVAALAGLITAIFRRAKPPESAYAQEAPK